MRKSLVAVLCIITFCCGAQALSSEITAGIHIPSHCKISGVPDVINVELDDKTLTSYAFTFELKCNFKNNVMFYYTSSCTNKGRSCIAKGDGKYVGFDIYFNKTILMPNQILNLIGNNSVKTEIIIDKARYTGTYFDTVTLVVNY